MGKKKIGFFFLLCKDLPLPYWELEGEVVKDSKEFKNLRNEKQDNIS